jgi:hypothetical protein
MSGEKERQGDFVFTGNTIGDYTFCFNNEMSTFAEKFVDFEIAVGEQELIEQGCELTDSLGRERVACTTPFQARHVARADVGPRRVYLQNLWATLHHLPKPKVLPHP